MRIRACSLLLILSADIIMLSGCWDYKEINRLSIVAGIAIDKGDQTKYKAAIELIDLHEGGREAKVKSKIIETDGETLLEAIRNTLKCTAPKLYWGHAQIVIISQDVAKEGIYEILDLLCRDPEPRLSMDLLVSKEKTAKEILDTVSFTTEIRSFEIQDMLRAQQDLSKSPRVEIYQFINDLSAEGVSPVLPAIGLTEKDGKKTSELTGAAIFKKDKLIGFLDDDDTKSLLFIRDKIKGGLFVIDGIAIGGALKMSLRILQSKTSIKPEYSNGKVSINIRVNTETALEEHSIKGNLVTERGNEILQKETEKHLVVHFDNLIKKVRKDFGVDIFGFGNNIKAEMPSLWRKIGADWQSYFEELDVKINPSVNIRNAGLLSKPIKIGD